MTGARDLNAGSYAVAMTTVHNVMQRQALARVIWLLWERPFKSAPSPASQSYQKNNL